MDEEERRSARGRRGRDGPGCRPSVAATADDGGPPAGMEEGEAHQRAGATADGERRRSPGCRPSMAAAAGGGGPPAGEEEGEAHQRVGAAADGE